MTQRQDPTANAELMRLLKASTQTLTRLLKSPKKTLSGWIDPFNAMGAMIEGGKRVALDPLGLAKANLTLMQQHLALWQYAAGSMLGQDMTPVATTPRGDRRFKSEQWQASPLHDVLRQSYLITSDWLMNMANGIDGLSPQDAHKVRFHAEQWVNALSPSNFPLTNPDVIKETLDSGGQNLLRGMKNLKRDIQAGGGALKITMSDPDAYEPGVNVATAPGKVVFQNDLIQLIQYEPTTKRVYRRPLVIFPPWINKFYILDLQPENSFVRYAVSRGYTVFVASWVNPDEKLAEKTMDDYLQEGILGALDAVELATGQSEVTTIGYCIGGTLMGAALAHMAAKKDRRVKATTFFAAQMDFSEAGDLKVYIDETQLERLDQRMSEKGFLDGDAMYTAFNLLRSNDLIWSFWVNNYLLGKDPLKFDLLYWNGDTTRMPRALHMFYLREMYLRNNLSKPGGITLGGTPIDLRNVDTPIYLQASREDHIAPYPSVFKAKNLFSGPVRFALAGSGHIAGVINPPAANKYNYWMNEDQPADLEQWLDGATSHEGSWWGDWDKWLSKHSGSKVAARTPGDGELDVIEDAPGSYALTRS